MKNCKRCKCELHETSEHCYPCASIIAHALIHLIDEWIKNGGLNLPSEVKSLYFAHNS